MFGSPRPRSLLLWGSLAALVLAAPLAQANPLPVCFLFVHVHPWVSNFCTTNPITECAQVVQHTEADGDLEFDLFMDNRNLQGVGIEEYQTVRLDVRWSPSWTYQYAENCRGGAVEEELLADRAILDFTFSSPVPVTGSELTHLGRVRMDVNGFGDLYVYNGSVNGLEVWCGSNRAQAGVECAYCLTTCGWWPGCGAQLTPEVLNLDVLQGSTAEGTFHADINHDHQYLPCPVEYVSDDPFVHLDVQYAGGFDADIQVTVDASELPLGITEAIVRAESDCRHCSRVVINVLESTAAPEGDPLERTTSWGAIKMLYR